MGNVHKKNSSAQERGTDWQGSRGAIAWARLILAILRDESGQDLIEYALVAGLVGLGCVVSLHGLQNSLATAFSKLGNALVNAI